MYKQICPKTIPTYFKVSGIYCISFGEHSYIGSSRNVQQRLSQHRKKLRASRHSLKMQFYYNTFGEEKMFISLLEICDVSMLKSREKYWIETLEPDINQEGIHDTSPQKVTFNGVGSKKVYQYDMEGNFIAEFPSVKEASRYLGVDNRGIGLCADNNYAHYKSAYGYRWSYEKVNKLLPYQNNSSQAVNKPVIVFDAVTGEERQFESIAGAVNYYEPNSMHFDSSCAVLSHCAKSQGYYLSRYLAKNNAESPYILIGRNVQIYNTITGKVYCDAKEAAADLGVHKETIRRFCQRESNKEWLYINQCARVKLRESGKLFKERQP